MDLSSLPKVLITLIQGFAIDDTLYHQLAHPLRNPEYAAYGRNLLPTAKNKPLLMHVLGVPHRLVIKAFADQLPPDWTLHIPSHAELDLLYATSIPGIKAKDLNRHKHTLYYQGQLGFSTTPGSTIFAIHHPPVYHARDALKYATYRQMRFVLSQYNRLSTAGLNLDPLASRHDHLNKMIDLFTPPQPQSRMYALAFALITACAYYLLP